jgi:magnesium transporter
MFRVLDLTNDQLEITEGPGRVAPPPRGTFRWIDLREQDGSQLELLRSQFDLHPLAIEDCAHHDQRPKVEEYRDHLFLVTQGFYCPGEEVRELVLEELHAFLGEQYLITVHITPIRAVEAVWARVSTEPRLLGRGVDFVYYLIADGMVDDNFPILDRVSDELEALEDSILAGSQPEDLQRIFELKRHLVTMRKVLSPQRDVLGLLSKRGDPRVSERTAVYLRDVYDHLLRITESIDANRDLLTNTLDAYLSTVGQRTNQIMKYLTLMSAVFLPLSFVVGFFGQNFDNLAMLEGWVHSNSLMWAMIVICLAVPVAMYGWFTHKRWL